MAMDSNQSGSAFPALTSIRFIAAFAVVVSHYSENNLLPLPSAIFDFIDGGRSAVSLFFVLSGFILTFTYRDKLGHGGVRTFYEARIARIYPMILLGLLLCVPVVAYLLYTGDASLMLKWYAIKEAVYPALVVSLVCQLLLINGWFPFSAIKQPWNGPSDSVSCEVFFYLLFPFLLRRITRMRAARIALVSLALWLATGVWIALLHAYMPVSRSGAMIYSMPLSRLSEFVMGIAAAIFYLRLRASGTSQHGRGVVLIGVASFALTGLSAWRPAAPSFSRRAVVRRADTRPRVAGAAGRGPIELAAARSAGRRELFAVSHSHAPRALVADAWIRTVERLDGDRVLHRGEPALLQTIRRADAQAPQGAPREGDDTAFRRQAGAVRGSTDARNGLRLIRSKGGALADTPCVARSQTEAAMCSRSH